MSSWSSDQIAGVQISIADQTSRHATFSVLGPPVQFEMSCISNKKMVVPSASVAAAIS